MKKSLLLLSVAGVVGTAFATTYMHVELIHESVFKFDVDSVSRVDVERDSANLKSLNVVRNDLSSARYHTDNVAKVYYSDDSTSFLSDMTVNGYVNGYAYVDLGLPSGLKWAVFDIGTTETGGRNALFAWGETEPKSISPFYYSWSSYKMTSNGDYNGLTKYCNKSTYGAVDNKLTLEPENDAATTNWGANWRMPTKEEFQELLNGCTWSKGIGTSKKNGNKIKIQNSIWLSNLAAAKCINAYYGSAIEGEVSTDQRCYGICVRGVSKAEGVEYKTYLVNFYAADSTLIESQQVEAGKKAKTVAAPILEGQNFVGWSDSSFTNVTADVNTYARYGKKVVYTVNFYDKDSTLIESQQVEEGHAAAPVTTPVVPDFLFTAWSDSSFTQVSGNINVYAQYQPAISISGVNDGFSYVDLGLPSGLKWATCNVGGSASSDYGNFFAWGETEPKTTYKWDNYKLGTYDSLYKYNGIEDYGFVDKKSTLESEDDAAKANMGEKWRMPTLDETKELIDGCDWVWIPDFCNTGTSGWLGTSKTNHNTVFLPSCKSPELVGYYWTSSLYWDYTTLFPSSAAGFEVSSTGIKTAKSASRYVGLPVRAVVDYSYFTVNFYSADSTLIESQIVKEGAAAKVATAPVWNGHVFTGWSDSSFTSVKSNLDIYAVYREKYKFNVKFYSVEDSTQTTAKLLDTQEVVEGEDASEPVEPKVFGLKFTGWDTKFTNIQSDLEVHAKFSKVKVYTVNFFTADSVLFKTVKVEEGDDITDVTAPQRDYESFVRWSLYITNVHTNMNVYPIYKVALSNNGAIGGYDYVDLGLESGLKWATFNVGASKPVEYGKYYAWGETSTKKEYDEETYKWFDGSYEKLKKYNTDKSRGLVDNKTTLELDDDAAHVIWGETWRMPTATEMKELIGACEWQTVTNFLGSSVGGLLGVSKKNGNSIFFPFAGFFNIYSTSYERTKAFIWTSTLSTEIYDSPDIGAYWADNILPDFSVGVAYRDWGGSVRAVSK